MNRVDRDKRIAQRDKILHRPGRIEVKNIEVTQSNVFASQSIELERLTGIVGAHGTGKTLLLRLIASVFGDSGPDSPPFVGAALFGWKEYVTGLCTVTVAIDGREFTESINLAWPLKQREAVWSAHGLNDFSPWYTSAQESAKQMAIFYQDYLDEYRGGDVHITDYREDDLRGLYCILGKTYDSVSVSGYEGGGSIPEGPFIEAIRSGVRYSTFSMSLGEIWVHYVLGWLSVLAKHEPLLIDEPESFLAPRGHRSFMDEMIRRALRNDSQLIVATHSPWALEQFPLKNIRICIEAADGVRFVQPSSEAQIRDSVGMGTPIRLAVLVEDKFARDVTNLLIAELDPALYRRTEMIVGHGAHTTVSTFSILCPVRHVTYACVLDGDQRTNESLADKVDGNNPLHFLPGTRSPESELEAAVDRNPSECANYLQVSVDSVMFAISTCREVTHQYWLARLSQLLGKGDSVVLHSLVRCWLLDGQIKRQAETLVHSLGAIADNENSQ